MDHLNTTTPCTQEKALELELGVKLYSVAELHKIGLCIFRIFGIVSNLSRVNALASHYIDNPNDVAITLQSQYQTLATLGQRIVSMMSGCADAINLVIRHNNNVNTDDVCAVLELSADFCSSMQKLLTNFDRNFHLLSRPLTVFETQFSKENLPDSDPRLQQVLKTIYDGIDQVQRALDTVCDTLENRSPLQNLKTSSHAGGRLQLYWPEGFRA